VKFHIIELGIEHLFTGVRITPIIPEDADPKYIYPEIAFEQISASMVRALCQFPMVACWQVKQVTISSVEIELEDHTRYSTGEVEWIAQRVTDKLRELDAKTTVGRLGNRLPPEVVKAMRRKHGERADVYMRAVDGPFRDQTFCYEDHGIYCGIEPDGYIHT
jgi:hypothetical protein